jgi:hypothetical protein
MWSPVLVGAAVIAIAGSSIVFAQQMEGEGERGQSSRVSQDDRTGFCVTSIARPHGGAQLYER